MMVTETQRINVPHILHPGTMKTEKSSAPLIHKILYGKVQHTEANETIRKER